MKKFTINSFYSGKKADFFSLYLDDNSTDEFTKQAGELLGSEYKSKILQISGIIRNIADVTGIRDIFFKNEGPNLVFRFNIGNDKTYPVRIYCIKYGNEAVILGGGGIKDKNTVSYQEQEDLNNAVQCLRKVDQTLKAEGILGISLRDVIGKIFEIK